MRTSSLFVPGLSAGARLTHAFSSSTADADVRPAAGRTLTFSFCPVTRRSYLPLCRPDALPQPAGRGPSRAAAQTNPHLRDIQESAR
jgi:hypothetical protein